MARRRDDPELDWGDLRAFLHAAQAGTLSGAARAAGVEHTTIGRRLSALERALGAPLVLRGPEGLRLTPLGGRVAPLVAEMARAAAAIRELVAKRARRVRLAVPSGLTRLFTTRLAELEDVSLEIVSGARPVDLAAGEADLAIRSGPIADPELIARKLADAAFALYASEHYLARHPAPASADDLAGHELIGFDPSVAATPPAQWLEARAGAARVVLRSREMTDMLAAAAAGVGLAVLPCSLGDAEPLLRRAVPAVVARRALSLVYRREVRLSPQVRAVIRLVTAVMRDHAELLEGRRPAR